MTIDKQELLDKYFPEALEATKMLVAIPSFQGTPTKDAPYGEAVKQVLEATIDLASGMGFKTYKDPQNRFGFADYGNPDAETFAILCHLDVVPVGNIKEWKTNPFEPVVKDGKLIGRGSFDDKGPAMMNLYAMKYLKDHNYVPKDYKIRIIFGLTEETTWESIRHYIDEFGVATHGYVPDGEFPVVYAEKWIVDYDAYGHEATDFTIKGGEAYNTVLDYLTYQGPKMNEINDYLVKHNIQTELTADSLIVKGVVAHGSLPWLGVNAATNLGVAMEACGIKNNVTKFLVDLHENYDFAPHFLETEDETGKLTQNLGIIDVENGHQRYGFTFRVPALTDAKNHFIPKLNDLMKTYSLEGKVFACENNVFVDQNSDTIKNIMKAYQEVTGDLESKPVATGGGTYAKAMPGLVAFGAEFDNANSTMHAYNEWVSIDDLKKDLEIYTKAIVLLTK